MAGFIYIMSNPSFVAGRVKIGKSDRDPTEYRKYELEGTGVPEPFKVEYFAFVDDHHSVERKVHTALRTFRPNKAREFFDVAIDEAVSVIRANSKIHYEKSFRSIRASIEIKCDSCGQRLRVPLYRKLNMACPTCGREWKNFESR